MSGAPTRRQARAQERARAVMLAEHYRTVEQLSVAEIAERLGRSPATVRSYFYDPNGAKARRAKQAHRGVCPDCGASTSPPAAGCTRLCVRCIGLRKRRWNRELIVEALRAWRRRYGQCPRSTDLSRSEAARAGGERLQRLEDGWEHGQYPALSVVQYHFATFAAACEAAFGAAGPPEM